MTENVQYFLLKQKLLSIYDTYSFLFALHYILKKLNYKTYPSWHFWFYADINCADINETLFYHNEQKYISIHNLIKAHNLVNCELKSLRSLIENKQSDKEQIAKEFDYIYDCIGLLLRAYKKVLKHSLLKNDNEITKFFNDNFFEAFHTPYYNEYFEKYCNESDNLAIPYLSNAESNLFLNDYIDRFFHLAEVGLGQSCTDSISNFKQRLMIHINNIILNAPYHDRVILTQTEENSGNQFEKNQEHCWKFILKDIDESNIIHTCTLPEIPKSFNSALFYMIDY